MEFLHPKINVLEAVSIIALQLSLESYFLLPSSTTMLVEVLELPLNPSPISEIVLGILIVLI